VSSFSQNFSTALQPQIVKTYSAGEKERMFRLIADGARITWFLLFLFVLPLALEMPFVLALWLKNPPEYTVIFARLAVIDALINSISLPLMTAARAPGKMKLYEVVLGNIQLICFGCTWLVLALGAPAYSVMLISIVTSVAMFIARLIIVRRLLSLSIRSFFHKAVLPAGGVTLCAVIVPVGFFILLDPSFLRLCIIVATSIVSTGLWFYVIGLDRVERRRVREIIVRKLDGIP
jgi:O-antigen/teichoic acid export membrane protein